MLVPVGIAYAEASGVPGIYGLYATIVPLLAYALFGPSRILVLGPDSALAAVILAVVAAAFRRRSRARRRARRHDGDRLRLVCIAAGLARLGFITELLSKPIRYGYMNGIALTVLLSQTAQAARLQGLGRRAAAAARGPSSQAVLEGKHQLDRASRSARARSR